MKSNSDVVCPSCKSAAAMRINRTGFLERRVLNAFGIYPWKCGACGSKFLLHRRGIRHSKHQAPDVTTES